MEEVRGGGMERGRDGKEAGREKRRRIVGHTQRLILHNKYYPHFPQQMYWELGSCLMQAVWRWLPAIDG